MPKKLHDKLRRSANRKGLKGDEADAYVYGTLKVLEGKIKKNTAKTKKSKK
jgi:hypothetical protein